MGIIFSSFNGLEPSLRFTGFYENWHEKYIKDVADVIGGGTPDTTKLEYWNGNIQWFTPTEIGHNKYVNKSKRTITEKGLKNSSAKLLPPKTILLTSRATIGECSIIEKECATNQGFQSLVPNSLINNEFCYYLINTKKKELLRKASGSTFLEISNSEIKQIKCKFPSLLEQQKIATFLSLMDTRIEKQRQLVESLKKYKRGLFSYYFQKNKSYKIARLGDFAKIYQPSTISQSQFNDGKYKVFGANGYIGNYDKYNHAVPQVTISCRGEKCGTVNFVDAYTWITGNSMVVNIDDQNEINKRYLYHCLSNQNLKYLVSGSAQPQIIRTDVARHSIPVPSIEFQEKLSFFLDSIEEKIKNEQNMEECLLDMKNALLQQMFI